MAENDIPNLSPKEFIAMNLLVGSKAMYGLQMVEKSNGELKRGTIYLTLHRLEEKGYVTSETEEAKPGIAQPRRLYKPSALGVRVFHALHKVGGGNWLKEVFAS